MESGEQLHPPLKTTRNPEDKTMEKSIQSSLLILVLVSSVPAQVAIPPNHPDLAYDGVWYPKATADTAALQRFSEECMADAQCIPPWTYTLGYGIPFQQPGVTVRFKTSSPTIVFKVRESPVTIEGSKRWPFQRFGVFRDGVFKETVDGIRSTGRASITGDGASHTWEVVLPHQLALVFLGLELAAGQALEPVPESKKPVYVALGDSQVHGEGQGGAYEGWPWKIARARGWELINLGIGGTTATAEMALLNLPGKRVDVVSIEYGYNEWGSEYISLPAARIYYENLVDAVRETQPRARIYCILPFFTTTREGKPAGEATLDEYRAAYREIVQAKTAAGDRNIFVIDGASITKATDLIADGVHLHAAGAGRVAEKLIPMMTLDGAPVRNRGSDRFPRLAWRRMGGMGIAPGFDGRGDWRKVDGRLMP